MDTNRPHLPPGQPPVPPDNTRFSHLPPPSAPPDSASLGSGKRPSAWKKVIIGLAAGIAGIALIATATFLILSNVSDDDATATTTPERDTPARPPGESGECADLFHEDPSLYPEIYRGTTESYSVRICDGDGADPSSSSGLSSYTLIIGNDIEGYQTYGADKSVGTDTLRATTYDPDEEFREFKIDNSFLEIRDSEDNLLESQMWLSGNMDTLSE